jgi:hypothetical protein
MWLSANVNSSASWVSWRRAKSAPALLIRTSIHFSWSAILSRHALYLGEAREIGKIYGVGDTRRAVAKSREGRVAAGLVPCG